MYSKNNTILLLVFSFFLFTILLSELKNYYPLYGSHLFQDWIYIYIHSSNSCDYEFIFSNYEFLFGCKEYLESNFVYPSIWLKISKIINNHILFEFFLIFSILTFIYLNLKILNKLPIWTKILFFYSPVSILLFERGNNDIIIFILIYFFSYFFFQKKSIAISILFYFFGLILKIYTISILPIFLIYKKKRIIIFLSTLIISIFLLYLSNFEYLQNHYNKSGLLLSFSSSVYFKIINSLFNLNINYKFLSLLLLLIIILLSFLAKIELPKLNSKNEIYFLIGSSIIVSSFFLTEGFIYKLVFLSFTFPLIHEFKNNINSKLYMYFLFTSYFALYAESFTFLVENLFQIDYFEFKENPTINYENIFFGFSIVVKNFIFWLININLIFISTKIFFRKIGFKV